MEGRQYSIETMPFCTLKFGTELTTSAPQRFVRNRRIN